MSVTVTLLTLGVCLLGGLLMSRLAKLLSLPAVTAYLVTGVLLGPFVLGRLGVEGIGFVSGEFCSRFSLISDMALGFIAFSIGNEFRLEQLKKIGKQATVIGIFQAVLTSLLVDAALIGLHFVIPDVLSLPSAITLGAVAAATAPAATLMVVRQYKAKGPLTDILLPIVALDDGVGLVIFSVSFGVSMAIKTGSANVVSILLEPILEVVFSLLLGSVMSLLLTFFERFFHSRSKRLSLAVCFVLLTVGLSQCSFSLAGVRVGFSSLLTCMMLGTIFCNFCDFSQELMDRCDRWTAPLFVLFFVLSGAELDLSIFSSSFKVVLVGIVFVLVRSAGKYSGAFVSAKMTRCDPMITKYLGITLLPQAGVALGMSVMAMELGGGDGSMVRNITLFAVLIYELVGPLMTKLALTAAGEITTEGKTTARGGAVR